MRVPLVTIAVTSRNYAHTIREAIDSALAQRYPALEILILDNASTDGTAAILASYANNPRVRIIVHPHDIGMAANHSAAVREAKGEYMLFLAADNRLSGGAIERAMHTLRKNREIDAVYSGIFLLHESGANLGRRPAELLTPYSDARDEFAVMLAYGCDIQIEAMVMRTARLREAGEFADDLLLIDYDMLLRLTLENVRIAYNPQPFLFYRLHENAQSSPAQLYTGGRFYSDYLRMLDTYITERTAPRIFGFTEAIKRRMALARKLTLEAGFVPTPAIEDRHVELTARLDAVARIGQARRSEITAKLALLVEGAQTPEQLEPLLANLAAQTQPPDEVVIIVEHAYATEFSDYAPVGPFTIRLVRFPTERSRAELLNTALMLTHADAFLFTEPGAVYGLAYFRDVRAMLRATDAELLIDTKLAQLPADQFERAALLVQAIPWLTASMLIITRSGIDRAWALHDQLPALGAWEWCIRATQNVSVRFVNLTPSGDIPAVRVANYARECAASTEMCTATLHQVYATIGPVTPEIADIRTAFLAMVAESTDCAATLHSLYSAWETSNAESVDDPHYLPAIHEEFTTRTPVHGQELHS